MHKSKRKLAFFFIAVLILLVAGITIIVFNQRNTPYIYTTGLIFGTEYHITYQSDSALDKDISKALNDVDNALSMFNKQSIISQINRNEDVLTNKMFVDVFQLAQKVSAETGGAFDITIAPMVNAWGFGFKKGAMPTPQKIDSLKKFVGYSKVSIAKNVVKKADNRLMLDCGGIAKGYGCDVVAKLLRTKGIQNFIIEIGGEIVASGINDNKEAWTIGVEEPKNERYTLNQQVKSVIKINNKAMATSGNYRNYYYKDGKKYSHIIDPRTGYPTTSNMLSATVVADNCATADAYATALMVVGQDDAIKIVEKHPEIAAYLIYSDKNGNETTWVSPTLNIE